MYRHDREKHGSVFYSVANIVQLGLQSGHLTFIVDYDESDDGTDNVWFGPSN